MVRRCTRCNSWSARSSCYSLGTKNKTLKYDADGSLTLYAGTKSSGADKESNWLPAPNRPFSLNLRAHWADEAILNGWIRIQVVGQSIRLTSAGNSLCQLRPT